jgi:hypothetical protein
MVDKSKSRAENHAANKEPFEWYTTELQADKNKSGKQAPMPKALVPIAHESIEVKNDGTKVCVEARLTPAHTKSLIKICNGDLYSNSSTQSRGTKTDAIPVVNEDILDALYIYRDTVKDIAILIELQHPGQVTKPFESSQRKFFVNLVKCLNRFTKTESIKIYIQTQVKNFHSDSAWQQFSDAVNFYRLNFVDWELFVGYMGQYPDVKVVIGDRLERRLDGLRLRLQKNDEAKRAKAVALKANDTASPAATISNTVQPTGRPTDQPTAQPTVKPKPIIPVTPIVEMFTRLSTAGPPEPFVSNPRVYGKKEKVIPGEEEYFEEKVKPKAVEHRRGG